LVSSSSLAPSSTPGRMCEWISISFIFSFFIMPSPSPSAPLRWNGFHCCPPHNMSVHRCPPYWRPPHHPHEYHDKGCFCRHCHPLYQKSTPENGNPLPPESSPDADSDKVWALPAKARRSAPPVLRHPASAAPGFPERPEPQKLPALPSQRHPGLLPRLLRDLPLLLPYPRLRRMYNPPPAVSPWYFWT